MSPSDPAPELDPITLHHVLRAAQAQVSAALWLSAGMLCAFGLIVALAAGWRRAALAGGLLYSLTLCFVPVGHARVLGPCGGIIALCGFARPVRRRAAP
jgi:hypothetical protein